MRRPLMLVTVLATAATLNAAPPRTTSIAGEAASPVVAGNTAFGLDLYTRLAGDKGNLIVSPYSISTALAMTYAGARGQTADEMARVLHFDLPADQFHPAYGRLRESLMQRAAKGGVQLHLANGLWSQKGEVFLPDFLKNRSAALRRGARTGRLRPRHRGRPPDHQRLGRAADPRQNPRPAQARHPHPCDVPGPDQRDLLLWPLVVAVRQAADPRRALPPARRSAGRRAPHEPDRAIRLCRGGGPADP